MGHWLMRGRTVQAEGVLTRFDPAYWTVNFPRPMMAAVTTTAWDALRVDCAFYRRSDLAGLIWAAEDRFDHPLLAYETARDFRRCVLSFRWRSGGLIPLDAVNGPVLTIEGRDAAGVARAWYVRLWNYAEGAPEDARVTLDFAALNGGFLLPDEADPVFAGDVDRMFVSLVPPGYAEAGGDLPEPVEGWAELSDISCEGSGAVLAIGEAMVPEHGLSICSGYDDSYNLTPERVLRNALHLGYRGSIVHYVGMSHYPRLLAADSGFQASLAGGAVNGPCMGWHRDFARRAKALGYSVIWSLSYELFDAYCPAEWKQRTWDGSPALTGWVPPSTLLSPANSGAMAYLHAVARAFVAIAVEAGMPVRFQIGEPWWWVFPGDGRPCLYDDAARAAFGGDPPEIATVRGPLNAAQVALLDQAGAMLAASTAALGVAVRDAAAGEAELLLLAYLPQVLDPLAPELKRANLPLGCASPAFDVLQLEDYDWAATGNTALTRRGVAAAEVRLNYPADRQHYFSGFVLRPEDERQWAAIDAAAEAARARGVAETFVWALPQVMRDGFIHFGEGEGAMVPFDDVRFPIALGREVEVSPEHSTEVLESSSGHEQRNANWASARTRYDVGPGVRSEADIAMLLEFYRARMGPARGFRLSDPFDWRTGTGDVAGPMDVQIGTGDGQTLRFALVKRYGDVARRITRPVAGSVRVAVAGAETAAFTVEPGGWVVLDAPPLEGAGVTAGFAFDVPVRFAEDRLSVSRATFRAGVAPSVPMIELREA
ncbi:DUF2460 domain-containing protein [Sphingomonas sp. BGYR3]|uniref:DUF2460 domain-containing protein n=1 Tax=Sphingomonas sp. BGYR3 TaxID=2975483 RepID=UPI0021A35524|nr:DUF2460 domain-containing protein [Sphingomonas sp. BGYR3]MDG5489133.1 DUF2460 domain-containing protein [Sphingomonas sp. BGYR3]